MSGCKAEIGSSEFCMSEDSMVICTGDYCTQTCVTLAPGRVWEAGTPLKWAAEDTREAVELEAKTDTVIGVLMCEYDLTDEPKDAVCEAKILCDAVFDTNMVCWPKDDKGNWLLSVEDLECIQARNDKPCFRCRVGCIELPEWVSGEKA